MKKNGPDNEQHCRQAVILAAGLGSRLGELKAGKPKAFLKVGRETLIERSCRILFKAGIEEIIIGTGFMHSYFHRWAGHSSKIECVKNDDFASSGSLLTLVNCMSFLDDEFLLLESDLLYESEAINQILDSKSSSLLASGFTQSNDEVFISMNDNEQLLHLSKDKSKLQSVDAELVGINKFSLTDLKYITRHLDEETVRTINYEIAFSQLAGKIRPHVKKVEELIWCEIDSPSHFKRACEAIYPAIVRSNE